MRSQRHGPHPTPSPAFYLDQNASSLGASGGNIATFGVNIMASVHGTGNTICLYGPKVHFAIPRNLDGLAMYLVTSGSPVFVILSSPLDFLAVAGQRNSYDLCNRSVISIHGNQERDLLENSLHRPDHDLPRKVERLD